MESTQSIFNKKLIDFVELCVAGVHYQDFQSSQRTGKYTKHLMMQWICLMYQTCQSLKILDINALHQCMIIYDYTASKRLIYRESLMSLWSCSAAFVSLLTNHNSSWIKHKRNVTIRMRDFFMSSLTFSSPLFFWKKCTLVSSKHNQCINFLI